MAIPPSSTPSNLGVVGGDLAGFPNGRRVADDVVNIELKAIAGATYPLIDPTYKPDARGRGGRPGAHEQRHRPDGEGHGELPRRRSRISATRTAASTCPAEHRPLDHDHESRSRSRSRPRPRSRSRPRRHEHRRTRAPAPAEPAWARSCSTSATGRRARRAHAGRALRHRDRDRAPRRDERVRAHGSARTGASRGSVYAGVFVALDEGDYTLLDVGGVRPP